MKEVKALKLSNGKIPFENWIQNLPTIERAIIDAYIDRISSGGGRKNVKNLGDGIFEIKIKRKPGYRVYFGEDSKYLILLLLGGDKGSQKADIKKAREYWRQYAQK